MLQVKTIRTALAASSFPATLAALAAAGQLTSATLTGSIVLSGFVAVAAAALLLGLPYVLANMVEGAREIQAGKRTLTSRTHTHRSVRAVANHPRMAELDKAIASKTAIKRIVLADAKQAA